MKMNLLDRYIAKTVMASIALITLMLAGLQVFILFVNQLDDLGKVNYGIVEAAVFILLQMPYQVYLFFPMASLLGSLIGLGILANHRELVVMRAAGMSVWQVTVAVLKAALITIVLVTLLGETLVPKLAALAADKKLQAMSEGQATRTAKGIWLRNQNDFISIGSVSKDNTLHDVSQFRFDDTHHMQLARKIEKVVYQNGAWIASNVAESIIGGDNTKASQYQEMNWDVPLNPKILQISGNEPDEMTLPELNRYLRVQKKNHQTALNYQLAYWQRLLQPFTTVVMMVLAIPFIFGPLRSSTMGSKLLAGAVMGFGFHIVNRIFGPISQVFQWPAEIAAFAPTFLFAFLGMYLMRRVR
ncbi:MULTISPECIES: LPS export ABC transporter permease LptG [Legionella]|uniref:LPS export ABC transporter permease LptG n=1 Tax=Legionella septentrionalis TaxID=2498109 RepID=A0A433JLU9_9GAMM|nr:MULTISPECIES: LPS export ABC transporter permease LptG [Legionella]MCP0914104.1 LPS export ABC transporter permease LptG [Legionella sp. 27cVA30]RUQ90738.1 LPS export ABC transporter permease LptG [Legionella septentrionalis]RUQ99979.1 LPS export ABC transporter permease LptG [Legionella septentrionalis]RUR10199.1 LPS export ABC transporter permease LptG [Legionella septentrionalis]RUR15789.1 LPS export ABC transporter permease LptG [Legionella septentrionalis]